MGTKVSKTANSRDYRKKKSILDGKWKEEKKKKSTLTGKSK